MEKNDSTEDGLVALQKNIENAAGKVAHRTTAQRDKTKMSTPENVSQREEAAVRCTAKITMRRLRKQARGEMQFGTKDEEDQTKAADRNVCERSLKTEENGKKNCKGIAKRCILTERKRKKNRKAELNTSGKEEINNLQKSDALQRLQSTWCCRQEPS